MTEAFPTGLLTFLTASRALITEDCSGSSSLPQMSGFCPVCQVTHNLPPMACCGHMVSSSYGDRWLTLVFTAFYTSTLSTPLESFTQLTQSTWSLTSACHTDGSRHTCTRIKSGLIQIALSFL